MEQKILSLQSLRAIAYIGIFLYHAKLLPTGHWGTSIFFALSGFLMTCNYSNKEISIRPYECIRFSAQKISKLYTLHLLTAISCLLVRNYELSPSKITWGDWCVFFNISLTQAWLPDNDIYFGINGVAWFLSACAFLYFMFPYIISLLGKIRKKWLIWTAVVVYMLQILSVGMCTKGIADNDAIVRWFAYICPLFRMGDFIIGCCIGKIFLSQRTKTHVCGNVCEILAILSNILVIALADKLINHFAWFSYTLVYIPVVMFTIYVLAWSKGDLSNWLSKCKLLIWIGNRSSYTFLIHSVVLLYIRSYASNDNYKGLNWLQDSTVAVTITGFILTSIVAEIWYHVDKMSKYGDSIK